MEYKTIETVIQMTIDGNVLSNAILKHYLATMSRLTGKTEAELRTEVLEIEKTLRREVKDNFEKSIANNSTKP